MAWRTGGEEPPCVLPPSLLPPSPLHTLLGSSVSVYVCGSFSVFCCISFFLGLFLFIFYFICFLCFIVIFLFLDLFFLFPILFIVCFPFLASLSFFFLAYFFFSILFIFHLICFCVHLLLLHDCFHSFLPSFHTLILFSSLSFLSCSPSFFFNFQFCAIIYTFLEVFPVGNNAVRMYST